MCLFDVFSGIHEFPEDVFSNQERMEGAVALHIMSVSVLLFVCVSLCVCWYFSFIYRLKANAGLTTERGKQT